MVSPALLGILQLCPAVPAFAELQKELLDSAAAAPPPAALAWAQLPAEAQQVARRAAALARLAGDAAFDVGALDVVEAPLAPAGTDGACLLGSLGGIAGAAGAAGAAAPPVPTLRVTVPLDAFSLQAVHCARGGGCLGALASPAISSQSRGRELEGGCLGALVPAPPPVAAPPAAAPPAAAPPAAAATAVGSCDNPWAAVTDDTGARAPLPCPCLCREVLLFRRIVHSRAPSLRAALARCRADEAPTA